MKEKFSTPGAIVLAGIIIAAAVVLARAPIRKPSPLVQRASPTAPSPSEPPITIRPVEASRDHIRGDVNAPITLVEYSDTECPFCKQYHVTLTRVLNEYKGKVRWVYRHNPLDALHSKARKEAEATECAAAQGKFWEYLDGIFAVTPSNDGLDLATLPVIAKEVGLDVKKFETCLAKGTYAERVREDGEDAARAGGRGTPHTIVLTKDAPPFPLPGAQPYENVKAIVEKLLGS